MNFSFFLEFCKWEGKSSQRLSFFLEFFARVLVFSAGGVIKKPDVSTLQYVSSNVNEKRKSLSFG